MSEVAYQDAIDFSYNYATAKPNIGLTEKEHILGLCSVLERVGAERDALADWIAANRIAKTEPVACPRCHGEGVDPRDPDAVTSCLECDGEGDLARAERLAELIRDCLETEHSLATDWDKGARSELSATPDDSLARLKAQWQAEALDEMKEAMRKAGRQFLTEEELELSAQLIRRQAEGGKP